MAKERKKNCILFGLVFCTNYEYKSLKLFEWNVSYQFIHMDEIVRIESNIQLNNLIVIKC